MGLSNPTTPNPGFGRTSTWNTTPPNPIDNLLGKEVVILNHSGELCNYVPENTNRVLIATEIGVWETSNLLSDSPNWAPSSNGLANVRVDMLAMRESDNMVVAASHGRGLFYGMFEAESTQLGDMNNDGSINILDVVIIVNMILESAEYTESADLNSDQTIDVLDIILLVNLILNS